MRISTSPKLVIVLALTHAKRQMGELSRLHTYFLAYVANDNSTIQTQIAHTINSGHTNRDSTTHQSLRTHKLLLHNHSQHTNNPGHTNCYSTTTHNTPITQDTQAVIPQPLTTNTNLYTHPTFKPLTFFSTFLNISLNKFPQTLNLLWERKAT